MCACVEPSTDLYDDFAGSRSVYGFVSHKCDVKVLSLCFFMETSMGILCRAREHSVWEEFYKYKTEKGSLVGREAEDMRLFIDNREYEATLKLIESKEELPIPEKALISKTKAGKKRVVYTFPREMNYVLKLITFLLRDYDGIFAPNLYSFRKNRGVKRATRNVQRLSSLSTCYAYKADISNYFNSVDVELILRMLSSILSDDPQLFEFFERLLRNPWVSYEGEIFTEEKGIMAGVPISTFFANVYLRELDFYFYERKIPYMRYSDDIIVFAKSEEELRSYIAVIKECLSVHRLEINPEKETVTKPHEKWTFLGFSFYEGEVDISEVSFIKLKAKMKRKARALERWARRKNLSGDKAARAFVKRFNAKLYDNPIHSELTWARWFFPIINTDKTLRKIDEYMEDTIRYLATGKRTKGRFSFRYEDIKALGFRSLVNEYHKHKEEEKKDPR